MPYFEVEYDNPVDSHDDFQIISANPVSLLYVLYNVRRPIRFIVTGYSNHKTHPKKYYINMKQLNGTNILFLKYTLKFIKLREFIKKL